MSFVNCSGFRLLKTTARCIGPAVNALNNRKANSLGRIGVISRTGNYAPFLYFTK
jgi:hypothetical protein